MGDAAGTPTDPVAATIGIYEAEPDRYADVWFSHVLQPGAVDLVSLLTADLPAGARVLDVGSGSGRDLGRLRAAGFDATGVDASAQLAARARRFGPVVVADMRDLPFADHSFDAILAAASLLHLPVQDGARALAEMARVLRPGGVVVVSVKAGTGTCVDDGGRFFQLYDDTLLDGVLTDAGFQVTTARTDVRDARVGTTWLVRAAVR